MDAVRLVKQLNVSQNRHSRFRNDEEMSDVDGAF